MLAKFGRLFSQPIKNWISLQSIKSKRSHNWEQDGRWKMEDGRRMQDGFGLLSLRWPLIECSLSGIRSFQSFTHIYIYFSSKSHAPRPSANIYPTFSQLLASDLRIKLRLGIVLSEVKWNITVQQAEFCLVCLEHSVEMSLNCIFS